MFRCPLLPTSLPPFLSVSLCPIFFQSVSLSIPRQTLPSVPISLRLARPLPFHPDDPATAPFLLSVWLSFTQMPPNHCPLHTILTYLDIYLPLPFPSLCLYLCPLYLFLTVSPACFLPPSLFSSYSPTAQMPGLVCNSCLAMCHYQVLPPTAGPSWGGVGGGGLGVEGAEWISHEYSCSLVCTTKQKMAPQRRLHPSQKKEVVVGCWVQIEGGKEGGNRGGGRIGKSRGKVMGEYGKWRQTERGVGDQTEWPGSIKR